MKTKKPIVKSPARKSNKVKVSNSAPIVASLDSMKIGLDTHNDQSIKELFRGVNAQHDELYVYKQSTKESIEGLKVELNGIYYDIEKLDERIDAAFKSRMSSCNIDNSFAEIISKEKQELKDDISEAVMDELYDDLEALGSRISRIEQKTDKWTVLTWFGLALLTNVTITSLIVISYMEKL